MTPLRKWKGKLQTGRKYLQNISKQKSVHLLLVAMQKGMTTLEDSLAVSYKDKHSVTTIQSSSCSPWYLPRSVDCQNLEVTKMFCGKMHG